MRAWWMVLFVACGDPAAVVDAPTSDTGADAVLIDGPSCVPSPSGQRARWRAEMNVMDSVASFHGVGIGASFGYTAGKFGSAFLLNGTSSAASISDGDMLWPSASFTVEAWVRTQATTTMNVIQKYACGNLCPSGNADALWQLQVAAGVPSFALRPDSGAVTSTVNAGTTTVNNGQWHHLVGVRDNGTSQILIYVDGVVRGSSTVSATQLGPLSNTDGEVDPIMIGAAIIGGTGTFTMFFDGAIDDLAYYDAAVTAADVAAIYAAPQGKCP